jgi:cysteine desulfurase
VKRVYLDHAATSPLRPAAQKAMREAWDIFGNPSSVHREGQAARALLDKARRSVGEILAVRAERVVFTSGGTEGANLALRGVMAANPGRRLLVSAIEHDCVLETARDLGGVTMPVNRFGIIDLAALESELKKGEVALVALMHANNETGVIQPVAEAARLAHQHGALMFCDAVQTVGHIEVRPEILGADLLSFSAHKFGGPKGVGVLVIRPEIQMTAQITGGGQERHRRGGTENVWGIMGLAAALEVSMAQMLAEVKKNTGFMDKLLSNTMYINKEIKVIGEAVERLPQVAQVLVRGRSGDDLVMALDLAGVGASQGSACSSGRVSSSHVLKAMGYSEQEAGESLRFSLGWSTTAVDIDAAVAALAKVLAA